MGFARPLQICRAIPLHLSLDGYARGLITSGEVEVPLVGVSDEGGLFVEFDAEVEPESQVGGKCVAEAGSYAKKILAFLTLTDPISPIGKEEEMHGVAPLL